jgi:hypothetical protein
MARGSADGRDDGRDAERYKQAANDALQQLDFAIGFLVALKKGGIATQLARNRAYIREQLMGEAAEPLPTISD